MAKKKTKLSLAGLILTALALVGAALAVTGVFIDWVKYTITTAIGNPDPISMTLKDLTGSKAEWEMLGAMNAFAYITLVLGVLSFLATAVSKLLNMKAAKPLSALTGLLTIVSTILLIVFVCMFCSKNASISLGSIGKANYAWAIGSILTVVGGFLSGLCALASYKK